MLQLRKPGLEEEYLDCITLAYSARDQAFMGHPACQEVIMAEWHGRVQANFPYVFFTNFVPFLTCFFTVEKKRKGFREVSFAVIN